MFCEFWNFEEEKEKESHSLLSQNDFNSLEVVIGDEWKQGSCHCTPGSCSEPHPLIDKTLLQVSSAYRLEGFAFPWTSAYT